MVLAEDTDFEPGDDVVRKNRLFLLDAFVHSQQNHSIVSLKPLALVLTVRHGTHVEYGIHITKLCSCCLIGKIEEIELATSYYRL